MTIDSQGRSLSVLHVATINKPISAEIGYGPIETVIHNIDKGLVSLGHRSLVACSADSRVTGEKYATVPRSLGDYWRHETSEGRAIIDLHLSRALERARRGDIDIIHMHEWLERVYEGSFDPRVPIVTTLHVPAEHSGIKALRERHRDTVALRPVNFVAISDYQKRQYADFMTIARTVHHGVDVRDYPYTEKPDSAEYLFSIGRITPVKGQDKAIEVAKKTGSKLILAGCVQNKVEDREYFGRLRKSVDLAVDVSGHRVDSNYHDQVMKPLLSSNKQIIYIGELGTEAKKQWYRHATATLFPIQWGEPFGMVLVESMACGTPIVAFRAGAVPEVVADGKTGFVVDSAASMTHALTFIGHIDRRECRRHVEEQFSIRSMAEGYVDLYEELARTPAPNRVHARTG